MASPHYRGKLDILSYFVPSLFCLCWDGKELQLHGSKEGRGQQQGEGDIKSFLVTKKVLHVIKGAIRKKSVWSLETDYSLGCVWREAPYFRTLVPGFF